IGGLAMAQAVDAVLRSGISGSNGSTKPEHPDLSEVRERVSIKWPNDVQIEGLKVSGLLAELLPTADGVIVGAGLNLTIPAEGLPTPHSTSLQLHGADPDDLLDRALAAYLRELKNLYHRFVKADGDAQASGIRSLVQQQC